MLEILYARLFCFARVISFFSDFFRFSSMFLQDIIHCKRKYAVFAADFLFLTCFLRFFPL